MANYSRGTSSNIIVGAAALFTYEGGELTDAAVPVSALNVSYKETLSTSPQTTLFRNVGYTKNGIELSFTPDFGEVAVDQVLDSAKFYKKGMKVSLKTELVESTLENLMVAVARPKSDSYVGTTATTSASYSAAFASEDILNLSAGDIGDFPIERGLIAIGPGSGDSTVTAIERIYVAYRALSIEAVTLASKRDLETSFAVAFRMLPNNAGSYGKIVDRTVDASVKAGYPN